MPTRSPRLHDPSAPAATAQPIAPPGVTTATQLEPLLLRRVDAARILGWSLSTFDRNDAAGRMPRGIKVGNCKSWPLGELRAWVGSGMPPRAEWEARRAAG